jgi:hypothetical protein
MNFSAVGFRHLSPVAALKRITLASRKTLRSSHAA